MASFTVIQARSNVQKPSRDLSEPAQLAEYAWSLFKALAVENRTLLGQITFDAADTSATVDFGRTLPSAEYAIALTKSGETGTPAVGAYLIASIQRSATGFTTSLIAAPGASASVTFDFTITR